MSLNIQVKSLFILIITREIVLLTTESVLPIISMVISMLMNLPLPISA